MKNEEYDLVIKAQKGNRDSFRRKLLSSVACFFIVAFVVSIRTLPAFASFASTIPGINQIVELINYDKGLTSAVKNDFIVPINISDEHDGLIFTVDNLMIDESRMIIFYTIENKTSHKFIRALPPRLQDKKGNYLDGYSSGMSHFSEKDMTLPENKMLHSIIDISFVEDSNIPNELNLQIKMEENNKTWDVHHAEGGTEKNHFKLLPYTWNISFSIDKDRFKNLKEEHVINKVVSINNQDITFENATIYPTRISVDISFNPHNSFKILDFDDLKLIDEKGNEWTSSGGLSGNRMDDNHITRHFQSNFFEKPNSLYITCSGITVLEKSKLDIIVDLEENKLLKAPDDKLTLNKIDTVNDCIELNFTLKNPYPLDKNKMFSVFNWQFKDSSNNSYSLHDIGTSGPNPQEIRIRIPKRQYKSPLTFTVGNYPSRINENFKVKIK